MLPRLSPIKQASAKSLEAGRDSAITWPPQGRTTTSAPHFRVRSYSQPNAYSRTIVDLYRYDPMTHSEVVRCRGTKALVRRLLVSMTVARAMSNSSSRRVYEGATSSRILALPVVDTLLGGGERRAFAARFISNQLVRRVLGVAVRD